MTKYGIEYFEELPKYVQKLIVKDRIMDLSNKELEKLDKYYLRVNGHKFVKTNKLCRKCRNNCKQSTQSIILECAKKELIR